MRKTAGTVAARSEALAQILEHALRYHEAHGDGACPVCGKPTALGAAWHADKAAEVHELREAAREATQARKGLDGATQQARTAIDHAPRADLIRRAGDAGLDPGASLEVLEKWFQGLAIAAPEALAAHLETAAEPLAGALATLRAQAERELQRREDQWIPIARHVEQWLPQARGERHADVEELLTRAGKATTLAALALFDDPERGKDVLPRLDKEAREVADTFRWCNEGAHEKQAGPMVDHIRRTERLAGWLRGQGGQG